MNDAKIYIPPYINTEPLIVGNQVFPSFYDFTLTEKDLERARTELGETVEKQEACLRKLKDKLTKDSSKVKYRLDDTFLLRFLRTRKYDVLKAELSVKRYYDMWERHLDWSVISPELKSVQDFNDCMTCLPYTDEEGYIVFLLKTSRWDPNEVPFQAMVHAVANFVDVILSHPKMQVNGVISIYDLNGFNLKHVSEMLKNGRLWETIEFVVIFILGSDMKDLHKHVNPALLPKRLNGDLEEEQCSISKFLGDNLPYIKYERSFIFSK